MNPLPHAPRRCSPPPSPSPPRPRRAAGATYQFSPVNQYGIQVTAAY